MCYTENSLLSQRRLRCARTEGSSGWVLCTGCCQWGEGHEELGLWWTQPVAEGWGSMNLPRQIASNPLQESEFIEGQWKALYLPPIPQDHLVLAPLPSWAALNLWLYMQFYWRETEEKYHLRLLLPAGYPSLSNAVCWVACAVGQKVLWERLRAGCKCQKWLAHVPALTQHTWSPKEVPMIQRPPFLSEYTVPIWMAVILPGARQGFHMLNLVNSFPWAKCPGWGAQMRARVPSEGLSVQPLLNPSPASVQCQILRHPDSLKLKSVANDCGKCGSGKWLCCTQNSWLVMAVIAVVLIILICMNLFCIGSCNVLICSCWVPFLLHALISS